MRSSTLDTIEGAGCRKLKKIFAAPAASVRRSPRNHIRRVVAGISGSSMLDTDARTSGNGLSSSSSTWSKSNSILTEAESATLGKLVERTVEGGRAFPLSCRLPLGNATWTSLELMAELTPERPVPAVRGVDDVCWWSLRSLYGSSTSASWFWESVEGGDSTGLSGYG
ncbi:hypothetical protein BD413DRAFT_599570 [Trametes elegans]|nr:hypothetical protein BD413DRAFT_599570 [Trametes elegans]